MRHQIHTCCEPPIPKYQSLAPVPKQMRYDKYIHFVLHIVEGIIRLFLVIYCTITAIILLGYGLTQLFVQQFQQSSGIAGRLMQNVNK